MEHRGRGPKAPAARRSRRGVRTLAAALGGTALAGALLTGCGGGEDAGPAEGFERLKTERVSVDYPKGWQVQSAQDRGALADGAVVLTKGGHQLGKISVVLDFDETQDADAAAVSVLSDHQLQGKTEDIKNVSVDGTDDGRRVDYSFKAAGTSASPPKGTRVNGVDVLGTDKKGETFLVRINGTQGALDSGALKAVADSVRVTGS